MGLFRLFSEDTDSIFNNTGHSPERISDATAVDSPVHAPGTNTLAHGTDRTPSAPLASEDDFRSRFDHERDLNFLQLALLRVKRLLHISSGRPSWDREEHWDEMVGRRHEVETVSDFEVEAVFAMSTPWERVKAIYQKDHKNRSSPHLTLFKKLVTTQGVLISLYCGFIGAKDYGEAHIVRHQATRYLTPYKAARHYHDVKLRGFFINSLRAARYTVPFLLLYWGIVVHHAAYRGRSSIHDYILASTATLAIYGFKHGPKGMAVTTGLGFAIGCTFCWAFLFCMGRAGRQYQQIERQVIRDRLLEQKYIEQHRSGPIVLPEDEEYRRALNRIFPGNTDRDNFDSKTS